MSEVQIEVRGGIAEVVSIPKGVEVVIKDIDEENEISDVLETRYGWDYGKVVKLEEKEYDLPEPE